MKNKSTTYFAALSTGKVDEKSGIISGVSIITVGPTKGHFYYPDVGPPIPMVVDETTLAQVKACIDAFGKDGIKIKIDHWSGFEGIVGAIKNTVADGQQLRGDMYLLKEHDAFSQLIEMAQTMPSQFGLSISFGNVPELLMVGTDAGTQTQVAAARCIELYSVDLVDQPGANPTGLFSAVVDSPHDIEMNFAEILPAVFGKNGTITELQTELATTRANLSAEKTETTNLKATLAQRDTELTTLRAELAKKDTDHKTALAAKDAEVKELAAKEAAEICTKLGVKPPVTANKDDKGAGDILTQLEAITDPTKRSAFYQAHKKEIHLAATLAKKNQ